MGKGADMIQEYAAYWDRLVKWRGAVEAVTRWDGDTYLNFYRGIFSPMAINAEVVADVGCGPALLYPLVTELWPGTAYYGYDVSSGMLEHARLFATSGTFTLIDGRLHIIPKADLIICHSVFTHIMPPDAFAYMETFRDSLRPSGIISVSIHTESQNGWIGGLDRIDYEPGYFEDMAEEAGLNVLGYSDVSLPAGRARYYRLGVA